MKKRILALFLSVCMFVSGTNIISLAETAEYFSGSTADAAQIEAVEAVEGEVQEAEEGSGSIEEDPGASGESDAALPAEKEAGKDASAAKQEAKPESQKDITIKTADGEMNYDEEWEKEYPYGAFAFAQTDGVICENGPDGTDSVLIPLYRVGSLEGRATAYVTYAAPVFQEEDGTINDMMALSLLRDATLEVERSDPRAHYQKLAAPVTEPAPDGVELGKKVSEENSEVAVFYPVNADGTPLTADRYIWQTRPYGSGWRAIKDSDEAELSIVLPEIMNEEGQITQDYRLVYIKDGKRYCTPAVISGDIYDPEIDADRKVPDGLETYEPMTFETYEPEDLYDPVEIILTYGEGEFVKYLRVTALDDDSYGIDRMGVFTISGTEGGDACNLCETYTLSRQDDDLEDKKPTQLGFTFPEISADCDSGEVTVFVKRIGDLRYPVTVKAETKDGTALAGKEYTHTVKTLAFLGNQSLVEFKVPLIAGQAFAEPKEFTVELSDVAGSKDLCSLYEPSSVKIRLTSGGMLLGASGNGMLGAGLNLSSMLATADGEDISGQITEAEGGLLGTPEDVDYEQEAENEALKGSYVTDANSYSYQNGLQLRRDSRYSETNEYWKDKEIIAGDSTETEEGTGTSDSVGYRNFFTEPEYEENGEDCDYKYLFNNNLGTGHAIRVSHNDTLTKPVTFSLPDAGLYFSQVYFKWWVACATIARYNGDKKMKHESDWRYIMPWVSINTKGNVPKEYEKGEYYFDFNPRRFSEDSRYPLNNSSYKTTVPLDQAKPALDVKFGLQTNLNGQNTPAYNPDVPRFANASCRFDLQKMECTRRVFSNTSTIGVTVHTANDEDTGTFNPITGTSLYESIRPMISLVPHESGVNSKGCLYAGSKLKVTMANSGSFRPYQGENASETVYVTRKDGSRVEGAKITQSASESDVYYITMLWQGMTAADLKENYTINVVLERRQPVQIDIRPSMDRDSTKTIDYSPEALKKSRDRFLQDKDGKDHEVTITVSKKTDEYPYFANKTVTTGSEEYTGTLRSLLGWSGGVASIDWNSVPGLKNIQSVNFGLDEEDAILFNGHLYNGNDTIKFRNSDLSLSLLNFVFYDSDFMDQESVMEATLVEEQYYYDANGNGKIDGWFNEETGFFETDAESGDRFVDDAGGKVNETLLSPVRNADGTVSQYFLRTFYTMTPRALKGDDKKKVQMLPVFLPSLVDPSALENLTEEQKSFRCIQAAATQIREFDEKTGELSQPKDIPVSSDDHPMYGAAATKLSYVDIPLGGDTKVYSQVFDGDIPEYSGNLRLHYENPSSIYVTGSDGLTEKVNDTNGYLGSFLGNTTYALYLQEQVDLKTITNISPESITAGTVETMTDGDGSGGIAPSPEAGIGFSSSEGNAELGHGISLKEKANLPTMDFGLFGFNLSMVNDNQLVLTLNIPMFTASTQKDWSQEEKNPDGTKTTTTTDVDGNKTSTTTMKDGTVVSVMFVENPKEIPGPAVDTEHTWYQETSIQYTQYFDDEINASQITSIPYYYDRSGKKIYADNYEETDIPLGKPERMPDSYGKSKWKKSKDHVLSSPSVAFDKDTLNAFEDFVNGKSGLFKNDESKKANDGKSSTTTKVSFVLSFKAMLVYERDSISGEWTMPRGSVGAVGTLTIEISHRFACFPPLYVFVRFVGTVTFEVELSKQYYQDGDHYTVTEKDITHYHAGSSDGSWKIEPGGYIMFSLTGGNFPRKAGFQMYLDGEVAMIAAETDQFASSVKKGHFQAQGRTVSADLAGYDEAQYVMLKNESDDTATVSELILTDLKSTYFSTDGLNPRLTLNFQLCGGVGIGYSAMHAEAFIQGILKLVFQLTEGGYGLTTFYAGVSAVLSIKFFFFSYSFDLVGHYWEKNRESTADNWIDKDYWVFGSKKYDPDENSIEADSMQYSMPEDTSGRQALYDAYNEDEETNAFHPSDPEVKFDISGYSTGADAFKLADHLDTGGDYKALSVDGNTYILYQIAVKEAGNTLNQQQLALSRVVTNGEHPGIENPVDPEAAQPYILVNEPAAPDQYMGTHAFSFGVREKSQTAEKELTVVWTGYDRHFADGDKITPEQASTYLVTKSASITLVEKKEEEETEETASSEPVRFSEPVLISDADPRYRYAAAVSGDVRVFAENSGTSSNSLRDQMEREYLKGRYGVTDDELDTGIYDPDQPAHQEPVAKYISQRPLKEAFGDGSTLVAVLDEGTKISAVAGTAGEHIVDLSFTETDGRYLAMYTTDQDVYVDSTGKSVTEGFDENTETAVFHRLYARELDTEGKKWNAPKLVYTCVDFEECTAENIAERELKDGLYSATELIRAETDPSINALRFIEADMDGDGKKTIFIFGFTGNTYLLRNDAIESLLDGDPFMVEPFFNNQIGYGTSLASDSEGNLVMAYLKAVEGTNSNGLFCAWWESDRNAWGEPYLLAMNHMTVYENANRFGLEQEDLANAFLGKETSSEDYNAYMETLTDPRDKGAYDRFVFSNVTALATSKNISGGGKDAPIEIDEETGKEIPKPSENSTEPEKEQLIILTGGVWSELQDNQLDFKTTGEDGQLESVPELAEESVTLKKDHGLGLYAICFGSGDPDIGQEYIHLTDEAFSAGKRLKGQVGFTNTGSASIRGSAEYPITVELTATGNGKTATLAAWDINDMIPSGREVALELSSRELSETLEDGTELRLSVSEDKEYIESSGGTPFAKTGKSIFTVGGTPDVGIESAFFEAVSADDDRVYANVELDVTNRGSSGTDHLFVQFTYKDVNSVIRPLNITGSKLSVGEQEPIRTFEAGMKTDESIGIFELKDKKGKSNLSPGCKRHVNGVLALPKDIFLADEDNGVTVFLSVFSDADETVTEDDVIRRVNTTERYTDNNMVTTGFEQQTFFVVPSQTGMSVHSTLHTVFSYTGTKRESDISIREISNGTEEWMPLLDTLYYDTFLGCIVATATAPGSTVIQIEDLLTGSFRQVVLKVTDESNGVNIFPDDYAFRFYDKGGKLVGRGVDSLYWNFFEDMDAWSGGDGAPMNRDVVSLKQPGGYFEFETTASYLEFYSADYLDVYIKEFKETVTLYSRKGRPGVLSFYDLFKNKYVEGSPLTIRVTPRKVDAQIDKYTAVYPQDPGELTRSSDLSPMFYWDRSFPNTSSLEEGGSAEIRCYITTPYKLKKCIWNGQDVTDWPDYVTKEEPMWIFEALIEENGNHTLEVYDTNGNYTKQVIPVRWFAHNLPEDAVSECPDEFDCILTSKIYGRYERINKDKAEIEPLPLDNLMLCARVKNADIWTNGFNPVDIHNKDQGLENAGWTSVENTSYDSSFNIPCSGFYVVRVTDTYGKWRQKVLACTRMSDSQLSQYDSRRMRLLSSEYKDGVIRLEFENLYRQPVSFYGERITDNPEYGRNVQEYAARYGGHYPFTYSYDSPKYYSIEVPGLPIKGLEKAVFAEHQWDDIYKIRISDPETLIEGGYGNRGNTATECEFGLVRLYGKEDKIDYSKVEWKNWKDIETTVTSGIYAVVIRSVGGQYDPVIYDSLIVDTSEISDEEMSGTVTILGDMIEGNTVRVQLSDMNYEGELHYQWYWFQKVRGKEVGNNPFFGATGDTLYLDPDHFIDHTFKAHFVEFIRCVVTSTMSPGQVVASAEVPVAPVLEKVCDVNTGAQRESDYAVYLPENARYMSITYPNGRKGSNLIPGEFTFPCKPGGYGDEYEYLLKVNGDLTNKGLNIELENEDFTYTRNPQTCKVKSVSYNFVDSVPFHVVRGDTATNWGTHKMLIEFEPPYSGYKIIRWTIKPRERRELIDPTKPEKERESGNTSSYTSYDMPEKTAETQPVETTPEETTAAAEAGDPEKAENETVAVSTTPDASQQAETPVEEMTSEQETESVSETEEAVMAETVPEGTTGSENSDAGESEGRMPLIPIAVGAATAAAVGAIYIAFAKKKRNRKAG